MVRCTQTKLVLRFGEDTIIIIFELGKLVDEIEDRMKRNVIFLDILLCIFNEIVQEGST